MAQRRGRDEAASTSADVFSGKYTANKFKLPFGLGQAQVVQQHTIHPIIVAAEKNDAAAVLQQLESGVSANTVLVSKAVKGNSDSKKSALHCAVTHNNRDMVEMLICAGARPDLLWMESRASGKTAYHIAISNQSHDILRLLCAVPNCNVDTRADIDWSPLQLACFYRDTASVSLLCSAGADPNRYTGKLPVPLVVAAAEGPCYSTCMEMVQALVAMGKADISATTNRGLTVFHVAVRRAHFGLLEWLCAQPQKQQGGAAQKADAVGAKHIDAIGKDHVAGGHVPTPLELAVKLKNDKIATLLVNAGASFGASDALAAGNSEALLAAMSQGATVDHDQILLFLKFGAPIDTTSALPKVVIGVSGDDNSDSDDEGQNKKGAAAAAAAKVGKARRTTPLHLAVRLHTAALSAAKSAAAEGRALAPTGKMELLEILLKEARERTQRGAKVDLDARDSSKKTALSLAVQSKNCAAAAALIDAGARPSLAKCGKASDEPCLVWAAYMGDAEMVRVLVNRPPAAESLECKNATFQGKNALSWAKQARLQDVVKMLRGQ